MLLAPARAHGDAMAHEHHEKPVCGGGLREREEHRQVRLADELGRVRQVVGHLARLARVLAGAQGARGRQRLVGEHRLVVEEKAHRVELVLAQPGEVVVRRVLVEPKGRVVELVLGACWRGSVCKSALRPS